MRIGAVVFALFLVSCHSCSEEKATPGGPPMPSGMLMPQPVNEAGAAPRATSAFSIEKNQKQGSWVEVQVAQPSDDPERRTFERWLDTSRYLSLDSMGILTNSFARAVPGFDLFVPRLLNSSDLGRLRIELADLLTQVADCAEFSAAVARWGKVSGAIGNLTDDRGWQIAKDQLIRGFRELDTFLKDLISQGRGAWILAS